MDFSFLFQLILILNAWNVSGNQRHEERKYGFVHHNDIRENRVQFKTGDLTTLVPQVNVGKSLSGYEGLNFIFNTKEHMGGFANVTENVGIAFINQDDGIIKILVDSKTGRIVRYSHLPDISLIENKDFKGDILKVFAVILHEYEYKNKQIPGKSTSIKPSAEEGLSLYSEIFLHLGHPSKKGSTNYRSFIFLNNLARNLRHIARGHLKGLVKGVGPLPVKKNLNRFVTVTMGLKKLFDRAITGLQGILKRGVKFEFNSLFNARNGAEVFVYILRQTGAKFNLANVWGRFLENISEVLKIIQLLGGGESRNGVDETIGIVSHVWEALTLKLSITSLIQYLTEASSAEVWSNGDGDFSQIIKDLKNISDEQARKYDSSGVTGPLVTFFSNLTANTLLYDKVNISGVVEKWRKRDVIGGLKTVIDVTLKWFSPEKYNNLIFDSFLAFLNSSSDPGALKRLIPQISLEHFGDSNESLWKQLSGKFDFDSQLKNNGDPNKVLANVPGFKEFSQIFTDKMSTPFDFSKILKGGTISGYFTRNLLQEPIKWTFDLVKDSGNFIKHIFWDPIKSLIPGIPHDPVFTLPTMLPILGDLVVTPKIVPEKTTEKVKEKKCEDDCDEKIEKKQQPTTTECPKTTTETPVTKKCESDCEEETKKPVEKTTEKPTEDLTEKECSDCKEKVTELITEPTTVEPTKKECSDCKKKVTEVVTEEPTKKECSDCKKKVTEVATEKPTKKECSDCKKKATEPTTRLIGIEFKHYQGSHEIIGHKVRTHHTNRIQQQSKHHELKHHQLNHHELKHHDSKHHELKNHQSNHHEFKHHESKHHESKHHESKHHESKHHESKHHESKHHESKHHESKRHELKHHEPKHHELKHHEVEHHELRHGQKKHDMRHHEVKKE